MCSDESTLKQIAGHLLGQLLERIGLNHMR
jgi:hypothetical protein